MHPVRTIILWSLCLGMLAGCGGEQKPEEKPAAAVQVAAERGDNVQVAIQPEQPTSSDCLRAVIRQQPKNPVITWEVNGQKATGASPAELCSDAFKRGDQVTVRVGSATAAVTIGNSLPRVTGISASPKENVQPGVDVEVFPVATDKDGDDVAFRYQWVIDGEADSTLTDAKFPGNRVTKGSKILVRITPYDADGEGPVYESYALPIGNTQPKIVTQPPPKFETLEYVYDFKAQDPDGEPLTYSLEKAPEGMTINAQTGQIVWPLRGVKAGAYPVKIVVTDPGGVAVFQEYTLTLGAPPAQ